MRVRLSRLLDSVWYGRSPLWIALWPLSLIYAAAYRIARGGRLPPRRAAVEGTAPVVVIGNITVGGTGKTPLIIWLVRALRERGLSVGVISRGYGGTKAGTPHLVESGDAAADFGDEPVLMAQRLACPVAVCRDRARALELLTARYAPDLVLADDGLQNMRLPRAVEIAVIDGTRGLGNERCLPAGPLREPATRLASVDAVVINGPGWHYPGAIRATVRLVELYRLGDGARCDIAQLRGRTAHAVAAIGNPERFFELLRASGLNIVDHPLPDHAAIEPGRLRLGRDEQIIITEKDAVKCPAGLGENVLCARIDMDFEATDRMRLLDLVTGTLDAGS